MRTSLLLCIVFTALGIGGFAGAFVAASGGRAALPLADPKVAHAVSALETELTAVKRRVASLEVRPAVVELTDPSPARNVEPAAEAGAPATPVDAPPPATSEDAAAAKDAAIAAAARELAPELEKLALDGVPPEDLSRVMAAIAKDGLQDAAVAAVKELIERDPKNPRLHYLLAKACYARLMLESTPAGYEKWGDLAVGAWDRALEIDPDYWEPRFERAEYFTYFPESEGRTPELVSELEKLIEQQRGSTANPRFARTYAHLSRMYLRLGRRDDAIRTLRDGAALFPDDAELRRSLEVLRH